MEARKQKYATAADRWAGMGPYYAMFPSAFADAVVARYSASGDTILDPFSGRGTSVFSAASAGRQAVGVELNPVGWIYARTKLNPAPQEAVLARIAKIESLSLRYRQQAEDLPVFFKHCYTRDVRQFLVCARRLLDWRHNDVDRTVMAFLMIHLHGKSSDSLSNQMMQTKAMAPRYAVKWWKEGGHKPPKIDPTSFFEKKLKWRYAKGVIAPSNSSVILGDSVAVLAEMKGNLAKLGLKKPSLMLTSPPYLGITNYHYDQWIRLWLLGGPPTDRRTNSGFAGKHQGKFANVTVYKELLESVFTTSAKILRSDAVVYVRTDKREPTISITREALQKAFPKHSIRRRNQPLKGQTQTRLFGHPPPLVGEVDFILEAQQ
jgi:hypothetical protein